MSRKIPKKRSWRSSLSASTRRKTFSKITSTKSTSVKRARKELWCLGSGTILFLLSLIGVDTGEMRAAGRAHSCAQQLSPYRSIEAATKRRTSCWPSCSTIKSSHAVSTMRRCTESYRNRELIKVTNDAPFYVDYLRRELEENYSKRYLTRRACEFSAAWIFSCNESLSELWSEGLEQTRSKRIRRCVGKEKDNLEGAIVVVRPQTGEIKAMVGGRNYQSRSSIAFFKLSVSRARSSSPSFISPRSCTAGRAAKSTRRTRRSTTVHLPGTMTDANGSRAIIATSFRHSDITSCIGKFAQFGYSRGCSRCRDSAHP